MKNKLRFHKTHAVLLILAISSFSCQVVDNPPTNSGFLKGKISIGPLCPVETNPPDPNCQPTTETYKAWATAIYSSDHKTKIRTIIPDSSGAFKETLRAGKYIIDFDTQRTLKVGGSNLPIPIDIIAGHTQMVSIDIDTGIR